MFDRGGIGEKCHPLPWNQLRYDTQLGGYVVDLNRERLEGAPTFEQDELNTWDDYLSNDIDTYYGNEPRYDLGSANVGGLRDPLSE